MAKRNVVDFKIINLSEEKFQELKEAGQIDPNALYTTPDETVANFEAVNARIDTKQDIATAVKYSDTEFIAHQAMPSRRVVDLTLGASGSVYTASADGYITLIKEATGAQQYIEMSTGNVFANMAAIYNGQFLYGTIFVSKGAEFSINYNAGGSTIQFKFIYANGAQ